MSLRSFTYSLILLFISFSLFAQKKEEADSLVRLLGCNELQQIEVGGVSFRKASGNVRFEHNSTMLLCDTSLWNVNANTIKAYGNVKIIQNQTVLTSENLDYLIDENLAQFRGAVVQLQDKDRNMLRTRDLDYNTKDSVAIFRNGGSFRDKDGQIIESTLGTYDSKISTFTFYEKVNMYTDSVFVKTRNLDFNTKTSIAVFGTGTNAWRDNNMLSSEAGWYDRNNEVFLFYNKAHVMTPTQEVWADSLKYFKLKGDLEMFGHVELLDTTRDVAAVAGYMYYSDSLSHIKMTRDPAVIAITTQDEKRDTIYAGADTLIYWTVKKCDIDKSVISDSESRLKELNVDPVNEYRRKAAEAAKAAAANAQKELEKDDPNALMSRDKGGAAAAKSSAAAKGSAAAKSSTASKGSASKGPILPSPGDHLFEPILPEYVWRPQKPDTLVKAKVASDSLKTGAKGLLKPGADSLKTGAKGLLKPGADSLKTGAKDLLKPGADSLKTAAKDSLMTGADSLAVQKDQDTTKIGFMLGLHNVKVFRKDIQVFCDSLAYNDLDSLIRLYEKPIVWQEIKRQYSADSITLIVKNQTIERASLMSNAFIVVQEDSISFDQIKGSEMMAYFDSTGTLKRYDALGGASGLFFIEENGALATVNKFESKMLSANLENGNIKDLYYFDAPKTNAYPVVQLKPDEKLLKGCEWQPDKRPKDPSDITSLSPRKSEREKYETIPQAEFVQTNIYYPGHIASIHKMLAQQDSIKQVRRAEKKLRDAEAKRVADSLKLAAPDSLALKDSLGLNGSLKDSTALKDSTTLRDSTVLKDSTALNGVADSLAQKLPSEIKDSLDNKQPADIADSLGVKKDTSSGGTPSDSLAKKDDNAYGYDAAAVAKARQKVERAKEKERLKAEKAEQWAIRDTLRQQKAAAKAEKWALKDAKAAERAKVKAEKALEKKRRVTEKTLEVVEKREAAEQKALDAYVRRFEKRKARQDARKNKTVSEKTKKSDSKTVNKEPDLQSEEVVEPSVN